MVGLLKYNSAEVDMEEDYKLTSFSVRCLKTNMPPDIPSNPSPENGAIDQPINVTLSWSCADPENDPLTFDLYFGTEPEPPLDTAGLTNLSYLIENLNCPEYYWKIVVFDDHGNIVDGQVWHFSTTADWSCGCAFMDNRDDRWYESVQIGEQCWMAENLNAGIPIDGMNDQTDNDTIEKYCYDNLESNCDHFGGLYQWNEAMLYSVIPGVQGICPDGWYLPSDEEWKQLEGWADNRFGYPDPEWNNLYWRGWNAGYNLKSISGWPSGGNGSDLYGFSALPGGYRFNFSNYFALSGNLGFFWASTHKDGTLMAWRRMLSFENNGVDRDTSPYEYGFSVRCIKANFPPEIPSNPTPDNGALNQPLNISLSWSCSDPNIDSLIFDIYFGTISDPPMEVEGLTSFFYNVSNLENNTEYYWKVIVYDCHGNRVESPVWNFTSIWECGDDFADQRDGEIYNTVLIGEQCWMAECLNVGTMIDGSMDQTDNAIFEKYCYNNIEDSCSNYGGLYQWNEVMQYDITEGIQGICPSGWHIPTDEEWKILEGTVDSYFGYPDDIRNNSGWRGLDAGYHLKSMSGWDSNGNGDDLYGFNATEADTAIWDLFTILVLGCDIGVLTLLNPSV